MINLKRTFLNKYGEVVSLSHKELGASWEQINSVYVKYVTKEEKDFLSKYGLEPTIFNVGNLRKYKHVHLTDFYVQVVIDHGAIDKRDHPVDAKYVSDIVRSVQHGLRAIKELEKCGCPQCKRAIHILREPVDRNTRSFSQEDIAAIQDRHQEQQMESDDAKDGDPNW